MWVCIFVVFRMCGCAYVWIFNVCVCMCWFIMCGLCVCVGFIMCGCVYVLFL